MGHTSLLVGLMIYSCGYMSTGSQACTGLTNFNLSYPFHSFGERGPWLTRQKYKKRQVNHDQNACLLNMPSAYSNAPLDIQY